MPADLDLGEFQLTLGERRGLRAAAVGVVARPLVLAAFAVGFVLTTATINLFVVGLDSKWLLFGFFVLGLPLWFQSPRPRRRRYHPAADHHERDPLEHREVAQRIARHGDDVGELARLDAADAVLPA